MSALTMLLPALVPVISDAVRGIIARITGGAGAVPQNIDEKIRLMGAEVERIKALAALDAPSENISTWVADLRGSFRYLAVSGIVVATLAGVFAQIDPIALAMLLDMTGASMSFIIGERMYLGLRK